MPKYALPTLSLICFGSARALTNAPQNGDTDEDDQGNRYFG